jgi:hypothetical protein
MNTSGTANDGRAGAADRSARRGQRFGQVTTRRPRVNGGGGYQDTYLVRDEQTGITYSFGYADIVTEGLRTIHTGERVRFLIDRADPQHASYVIRLDLPDIGEYYK